MNLQNVTAKYDLDKGCWTVSNRGKNFSYDTCIITQCTVEIPDDATGIQDAVFYGACLHNKHTTRFIEPHAFFFNSESKRFEERNGNEIVFDGTDHIRLPKGGKIFSHTKNALFQD